MVQVADLRQVTNCFQLVNAWVLLHKACVGMCALQRQLNVERSEKSCIGVMEGRNAELLAGMCPGAAF